VKISDFFDVLEREIKLSRTISSSRREDKKEDMVSDGRG